jgi:GDSL-like Lipase/Acylhydrolase family
VKPFAPALLAAVALAAPSAAGAAEPPVVPSLHGAVRDHVVAVYRAGLARGNRPGVFAKVGDSITESASFLQDVGCGQARLGARRDLAATIAFFRRTRLPASYASAWCTAANSFTRASAAATTGWDAAAPLARLADPPPGCGRPPLDRPLRCELRLLRPAFALVLYGTNDVERTGVATFRVRLRRVVRVTLAAGTVPVLSTIPPRHDRFASRVSAFNAAIAGLAAAERVPLWNYHRALTAPGLLAEGISPDGIHPSVYSGDQAAVLDGPGLRYGYNVRNLTALEVLAALRRAVR